MHGKVSVFRQNSAVAILTADSKRSYLASLTELPISVRLAMCQAERESDSSGCRASVPDASLRLALSI